MAQPYIHGIPRRIDDISNRRMFQFATDVMSDGFDGVLNSIGPVADQSTNPGGMNDGLFGNSMASAQSWNNNGQSTIPHVYECPDYWDTNTRGMLLPGTIGFSLRVDVGTGQTAVLPITEVNRTLRNEYRAFMENVNRGEQEAIDLYQLLQKYGDAGLARYEYRMHLVKTGQLGENKVQEMPDAADLERLHGIASREPYCWLTSYGVLHRINFAGIVSNTSDGANPSIYDTRDRAAGVFQVNATVARRADASNVFGESARVTPHALTWVALTRQPIMRNGKEESGQFVIIPGASGVNSRPRQLEYRHLDWTGLTRQAHVWQIGTVREPPTRTADPTAMLNAVCANPNSTVKDAIETSGHLPTLVLNVGY